MKKAQFPGDGDWCKRLKRSLLLLAIPIISALGIAFGSCMGGTTTRAIVRSVLPIRSMRHHLRVHDTWFVRRVDGQYLVTVDEPRFSPDQRGLAMKADQYKSGCIDEGFWAPTRTRHGESWRQFEFVEVASDQSEYYAAMTLPDAEQSTLKQTMLDELIAHVPDRSEGFIEVERGPMHRVYQKTSLLLSGYIHNTIVLLCAVAGLFELGRAVRGFVRSP